MRENEPLVLSAANLNIIEKNLDYLASGLGNVKDNLQTMDSKVNQVTNSVQSVEEEIKKFMVEIKGNTVVSNARQSIMMDQNELNKKYGHYDNVRRKVTGIFQATDIEGLKRSTIENIGEQVLIDTPDYWLAPALVAISSWFNNRQDLAYRALMEAMRRNDEKTSLLLFLIHLRANRVSGANKWLKRYLEMQDPAKMENKVITILDAAVSGILDISSRKMCYDIFSRWYSELNAQPGYKDNQIERWSKYIDSFLTEDITSDFSLIDEYTLESAKIRRTINMTSAVKKFYESIKNTIEQTNKQYFSKTVVIDKIINDLVFDYENEELELRKNIAKNRLIVEHNGDIDISLKEYEKSELAYKEINDFFNHISNVTILSKDLLKSTNAQKFSIAFAKDWILAAFNNTFSDTTIQNSNITIKIDNWTGITIDGSNEKELISDLYKYIDEKNYDNIRSVHIIDNKMIIIIIALIVVTAALIIFHIPYFIILILWIISLILFTYLGYM